MPSVSVPSEVSQIGFFSDLHGNYARLLQLLKQEPGVGMWFHAGDLVTASGPRHDNDPTMRLITKYGIQGVKGNHEFTLGSARIPECAPEFIPMLSELPVAMHVVFGELRILLIHVPHEAVLASSNATVVVTGHTHQASLRHDDALTIVDTGSLGLNDPGDYVTVTRGSKMQLKQLVR